MSHNLFKNTSVVGLLAPSLVSMTDSGSERVTIIAIQNMTHVNSLKGKMQEKTTLSTRVTVSHG